MNIMLKLQNENADMKDDLEEIKSSDVYVAGPEKETLAFLAAATKAGFRKEQIRITTTR